MFVFDFARQEGRKSSDIKSGHNQEVKMKLVRLALVAVVMIAFVGCSDKGLTSGAYTLSQINFTKDECKLKEYFSEGHQIKLTVAGNTVTVWVADDTTPPTGIITGDSFTVWVTKTDDTIPDTNCQDKWVKKMTGTVIKKNTSSGVYDFSSETISGSDCSDKGKIGYKPPKCTSTMTFTATKK